LLICGHLWTDQPGDWADPWQRWTCRAEILIPPGAESSQFSAARIFAAAYSEAVTLASLLASPAWRSRAAGGPAQQQHFITAIGQRLGRPGYQPPGNGDAIAHWMKYDSWRPPSLPHTTFPQTRGYRSSPARPATTSRQSLQRHLHRVVPALPPRRPRHPAPRPHSARPDPGLVAGDGRHHRHHLGQPDHAAWSCPRELTSLARQS
jgi:hypothetical protein